MGRPTIYTPELATKICERIAMGESLRAICRDDEMPAVSTVCLWVVDDREGFSEQYARARMAQATMYADEIVAISDDVDGDPQRDRLRVDSRKWYTSKVLPKIFGDKTQMEVSGTDGGPVAIAITRRVVDAGS